MSGSFTFQNTSTKLTLNGGRHSVSFPISPVLDSDGFINEIISDFRVGSCFNSFTNSLSSPTDGLTSAPETNVIKCLLPDGSIQVLATSSIRFISSSIKSFRNTTATFLNEQDDLVQAMENSMDAFSQHLIPQLFVETNIKENTMDILACYTGFSNLTGTWAPMCRYSAVNAILVSQQVMNPVISQIRKGAKYNETFIYSLGATFDHYVAVKNGVQEKVSFVSIKQKTAEISSYLASLGQNAQMDWTNNQFIVIYDVYDILDGFDVPVWLIIVYCILVVICFCLFVYSRFLLRGFYGSLYYAISQQLAKREDEYKAPFLMKFDTVDKKFHGFPVVSREQCEINTTTAASPSMESGLETLGYPSDISLTRPMNVE
jgi:hypothetical protein